MPNVKACIKSGAGEVEVSQIHLADPGPGQALIRTEMTTICGSDIHIVDQLGVALTGLPQGHEAVGRVEAVGEGVERLRVGDRVASSCLIGCGHCSLCGLGDLNLCRTFNAPLNVLFGCQSEAFLVNAADRNVAVVPESSDARLVLLATDILATAFAAVRRAELRAGQTVAVFALGPVGLCVVAVARYLGAERIFAIDPLEERRAVASRLGATDVLHPDAATAALQEATAGIGVDVAFEALGSAATFASCLTAIRMGGTVSSVGLYFGLDHVKIPTSGAFYQQRIVTTLAPAGHQSLSEVLSLLDEGKLDLSPLFTHEGQLSDIPQWYDRFRRHEDGLLKVAIAP